jgi:protoporphyrinogen oxidase
MHLVIIGGGITGLSAAWEAQQRGIACTLLEASDRWGGKVISSELGMTGSRFIVDLMRLATGNALVAYSTLFGMEAVILIVALYLTTRLDMGASQASAEERDLVKVAASAD